LPFLRAGPLISSPYQFRVFFCSRLDEADGSLGSIKNPGDLFHFPFPGMVGIEELIAFYNGSENVQLIFLIADNSNIAIDRFHYLAMTTSWAETRKSFFDLKKFSSSQGFPPPK